MDEQTAARIRANPHFAELEESRKRFSWTLTILILVIYYGFILIVAFTPGVIGIPVGGSNITVGILLGVGVILSAIILTGIYVLRANSEFDRKAQQVLDYHHATETPR